MLLNAQHLYNPRAPRPPLPASVIEVMRFRHPQQFLPYQYEGLRPTERQVLRGTDISMRLIDIGTPVDPSPVTSGQWAPVVGGGSRWKVGGGSSSVARRQCRRVLRSPKCSRWQSSITSMDGCSISDPSPAGDCPNPGRSGDALTAVGLHPYFGPTHRPGILRSPRGAAHGRSRQAVATNNFGFPSRVDYPFGKTNDRPVCHRHLRGFGRGHFCGSVRPRLEETLRRSGSFENRELVTLCFSHEGYKQPQQLLVLNYFLSIGQSFDLVDQHRRLQRGGARPHQRSAGWDISMPSHGISTP